MDICKLKMNSPDTILIYRNVPTFIENTNYTCLPTAVQYSTILYSALWYSTVLYGTVQVQYCMVQYSTAWYSTGLLEQALQH